MSKTIKFEVEAAHAPAVLRAYARAVEKTGDTKRAEDLYGSARRADERLEADHVAETIARVAAAVPDCEAADVHRVMEDAAAGRSFKAADAKTKAILTLLAA